jgi:hypothetical protein
MYDASQNRRSGGLAGRTELLSMLPIQDMTSPAMFLEKISQIWDTFPTFARKY